MRCHVQYLVQMEQEGPALNFPGDQRASTRSTLTGVAAIRFTFRPTLPGARGKKRAHKHCKLNNEKKKKKTSWNNKTQRFQKKTCTLRNVACSSHIRAVRGLSIAGPCPAAWCSAVYFASKKYQPTKWESVPVVCFNLSTCRKTSDSSVELDIDLHLYQVATQPSQKCG